MKETKILLAGVGNELRQDDAFGIAFVRQFEKQEEVAASIKIMEVGIGGIHLVQELHSGYDILIMADAVEWGDEPGKIYFREVESIRDIGEMPLDEKRAFLADMHYTNPLRALMLAKALKALPKRIYVLGCEAAQHDDFAIGMSRQVENAIPKAVKILEDWLKNKSSLQNQ